MRTLKRMTGESELRDRPEAPDYRDDDRTAPSGTGMGDHLFSEEGDDVKKIDHGSENNLWTSAMWKSRHSWRAPKERLNERALKNPCDHRFTRFGSACAKCGVKA